MLTLLSLIVVLAVLIFVHELGHYMAAKSVDIEVQRFSLGFGPRIAGFRRGETEYVISAIPLGGYVKMAGMDDEEVTGALEGGAVERSGPSPRDFESKPLWARVWVVSAGVIMNFLFAFVVYTLLSGVWGDQLDPTTRVFVPVDAELEGALAPLAEVPFGARVVAVGDREVRWWNDIQRPLVSAPAGPITLRFADAPPVTLDLPAGDSARVAVLRSLLPLYEPVIGQVEPGAPAELAGLEPGDRIVTAAGRPIRAWQDFVRVIERHPDQAIPLEVERGGQRISLTATPESREFDRQLQRASTGYLGVGVQIETVRREYGPIEAISQGATTTWENSSAVVRFLGGLFVGDVSPRNVGSIFTIGQISGRAAALGLESFLQFMAFLSINLAVMNLLPIPVLDGGHLLFLGLEAIRGRPLSIEQRIRLSHVGLIIIVGIMIWAMTNDVLRLLGI